MTGDPVRISAHATHSTLARRHTLDAYRDAVAARADYVELDIRRTADDKLVAFHDARTVQGTLVSAVEYAQLCDLSGYEVPTAEEVLTTVKGYAKGHLDVKDTGTEERLTRLALDILGPGEFIITTLEDSSVAAIRSRFRDAEEVPVALTLGRGNAEASRLGWLRTRRGELWPLSRVRACGADWVALDHRLALTGVARRCRQQQLKIMVWTVNSEREIRYWLSRSRTDVLITDRTALAVAIRDQAAAG